MRIEKITLNNFKNYSNLTLHFDTDINCFVGNNGSGKTNILDSIYFLLLTKGSFNIDNQLIKHGESYAICTCNIESDFISAKIELRKKKQFNLNKNPYKRIHEHIGKFPLVMVSPYDTNLIHGGSENRRKFIDGIIAQINPEYLENLINYTKLLKHRNALLKDNLSRNNLDKALLSTIDSQIIPLATFIYNIRDQFMTDFIPVFKYYYEFLSGKKENVELQYETRLKSNTLEKLFNENLQKDIITGRSNYGVHKDDYIYSIDDQPLNKFGSQGQQKTYVMALKFANFEILKKHSQKKPILLLDDLFDRIDEDRIDKFLKLVNEGNFGQIFITDTHKSRIQNLFHEQTQKLSIFRVDKGHVTLEKTKKI